MVEKAEEIYHILLDAGLSEKDLESSIKQKSIEFKGLMSRDAILFLIAKEKGIIIDLSNDEDIIKKQVEEDLDYNDFLIPISKITEGLQNIVISGKISHIFCIRDFIRKDGSSERVGTFQVCDSSKCITVVVWGDHVKYMENNLFQKDILVQVIGGYAKKGLNEEVEVHLSRQGKIMFTELKQSKLDTVVSKTKAIRPSKCSIQDLYEKDGFIRSVSGIVQVDEFKEITLKSGDKTFLLKITLSDGTGSIKINIWDIKALELVKMLSDGDNIKISNIMIKLNSYSNEKEISLTKNSRIEAS